MINLEQLLRNPVVTALWAFTQRTVREIEKAIEK